jgi:hypothetical protein
MRIKKSFVVLVSALGCFAGAAFAEDDLAALLADTRKQAL